MKYYLRPPSPISELQRLQQKRNVSNELNSIKEMVQKRAKSRSFYSESNSQTNPINQQIQCEINILKQLIDKKKNSLIEEEYEQGYKNLQEIYQEKENIHLVNRQLDTIRTQKKQQQNNLFQNCKQRSEQSFLFDQWQEQEKKQEQTKIKSTLDFPKVFTKIKTLLENVDHLEQQQQQTIIEQPKIVKKVTKDEQFGTDNKFLVKLQDEAKLAKQQIKDLNQRLAVIKIFVTDRFRQIQIRRAFEKLKQNVLMYRNEYANDRIKNYQMLQAFQKIKQLMLKRCINDGEQKLKNQQKHIVVQKLKEKILIRVNDRVKEKLNYLQKSSAFQNWKQQVIMQIQEELKYQDIRGHIRARYRAACYLMEQFLIKFSIIQIRIAFRCIALAQDNPELSKSLNRSLSPNVRYQIVLPQQNDVLYDSNHEEQHSVLWDIHQKQQTASNNKNKRQQSQISPLKSKTPQSSMMKNNRLINDMENHYYTQKILDEEDEQRYFISSQGLHKSDKNHKRNNSAGGQIWSNRAKDFFKKINKHQRNNSTTNTTFHSKHNSTLLSNSFFNESYM